MAQHGRKRAAPGQGPSKEEEEAMTAKIARYRKLAVGAIGMVGVWGVRGAGKGCLEGGTRGVQIGREMSGEDVWTLTQKILEVNPDVYPLWSHRRRMLGTQWSGQTWSERSAAVQRELSLTQEALSKRNAKSYSTWHHRQWAVALCAAEWGRGEGVEDVANPASFEQELRLCSMFLERDERNFHCWNYWRWLSVRSAQSAAERSAFCAGLLGRNFSNYSAWHERAQSLHGRGKLSAAGLGEEMEYVRSALFTEPDDQAAWVYLRWVVEQLSSIVHKRPLVRPSVLVPSSTSVSPISLLRPAPGALALAPEESRAAEWVGVEALPAPSEPDEVGDEDRALAATVLRTERAFVAVLAATERASRWPLLGLADLQRAVRALPEGLGVVRDGVPDAEGADELLATPAKALWRLLETRDPGHAAYYRYMAAAEE